MEKRIVYIAYLIIAFVVFDFLYGFTDWIATWQLWNWYLIILLLTIAGLLLIKYKQNQRKLALDQYAKENDRRRIQLNQLLLFEQLDQLNDELFNELLQRFYELKGYEQVELVSNPGEVGYHLTMWNHGQKIIVKWFKRVPMVTNLYTDPEGLDFALGELVSIHEIRDFYGSMKDYEVQADIAIALCTSDFDEAAQQFANRNKITLMAGHDFYREVEQLKEDGMSLTVSEEMVMSS